MKSLLTIILIVFSLISFGQRRVNQNLAGFDKDKRLHFGFLLSINYLKNDLFLNNTLYKEDTIYALNIKPSPGFNLGIVTDFHLGSLWDFRLLPSLIFGQQDYEYLLNTEDGLFVDKRTSESTYLSFPLELKYKAERYGNWRPFLTSGGFFAYDMASQKNTEEGVAVVRLKSWDMGYSVGFGFEFFLEYFKFATQLKWDKGVRNLLINDNTPFTDIVDGARSNTFTISFTFEG